MTLRQSQFVAPVPLIVANELGYLKGIDLEVTRTNGSAEQLRSLLSGEVDLVVTAMDNLYEWTKAGADLLLVAQLERTTPLRLYSKEGASVSALSGARFAVDAYANGFALIARHLLAQDGIAVDYVEMGGVRERFESLLSGETDATLLGPPFDGKAESHGLRLLASVDEILPGYPGQGLVVRAALAESEELVDYLAALLSAVVATKSISEATGVAILERNGFQSTAVDAWNARPLTLDVDPAGLTMLADIRDGLGLLPPDVDLAGLHHPAPLRLAAIRQRGLSASSKPHEGVDHHEQ